MSERRVGERRMIAAARWIGDVVSGDSRAMGGPSELSLLPAESSEVSETGVAETKGTLARFYARP